MKSNKGKEHLLFMLAITSFISLHVSTFWSGPLISTYRICGSTEKTLIRLCRCTSWSWHLLFMWSIWVDISRKGSFFFLIQKCMSLHRNICCGYSLELPKWGTYNEYPHVFMKKKEKQIRTVLLKNVPTLDKTTWSQMNLFKFSSFRISTVKTIYSLDHQA